MREDCFEAHPQCPLLETNACFKDSDHIIPQRLARTALAKALIYSQQNIQQLCRYEHMLKTDEGDEPLPPTREIIRRLEESDEHIPSKVRRTIRRYKERNGE